ncbi:MAG: adenosylhomocysteinase, partial [Peptococcaceae bacterium]|nr:adenosylhomocysteinase [Peptococcaceae bacterium]
MSDYSIRNEDLATLGRQKINWVAAHMPALNALKEEFIRDQPFNDLCIALSIHLEAKTAYLAEVLQAGGAKVAVTGSNPLSTQDDIAAALASNNINVYAWHNASDKEYKTHLLQVLDHRPQILIDDGGDLVNILHTERRDQAKEVLGGCEETTTGVRR